MHKLIIVESPAKCKKIESYVGGDYKCVASYGHFRNLETIKDIDTQNKYKLTFRLLKEKAKAIATLKRAIDESYEVILASDDDREGEAIAWHICQHFGLCVNSTKRIIFHEITKPAIIAALKNPIKINMNVVYAQHARQCLDVLVGFRATPLLWKYICPHYTKGLSAGRCQTPALRLIYENAEELEKNDYKTHNKVFGYFTSYNNKYELNKSFIGEEDLVDFLEKCKSHKFIFRKQSEKIQYNQPPQPFTTSVLQQKGSSLFNLSPKDTMKCCQKLYESGLITYMRTDSKTYSEQFCEDTKVFVTKNYGDDYVGTIEKFITKDKGAHEAIRPTYINKRVEHVAKEHTLTSKEQRIYALIWTNAVESLMSASKKTILQVKIDAPCKYYFSHSYSKTLFSGWEIIENKKEETYYDYILLIKDECIMDYNKIDTNTCVQNMKSHLSYATLVRTLETKNIGRPSTYASIVEKLLARGYVRVGNVEGIEIETANYSLVKNSDKIEITKASSKFGNEKNKLILEPLGFLVMDFVLNNITELFEYEFTSVMEDCLDRIARGSDDYSTLMEMYDANIVDKLQKNELENINKWLYPVGENAVVVLCKHGIVVKIGEDEFKKMKNDVNFFKVKAGEYTLDEICEETKQVDDYIGKYKAENMYVKRGKYGPYVAWGSNTKSLNGFSKERTLENIVEFIEKAGENSNIIRVVNESTSIRRGKYGIYIFYKSQKMNKPKFLKLKGFPEMDKIETVNITYIQSWIKETYNI